MALPAETISHIFSFLQSDRATLRACSKGHPFLSQLAEQHLYSIIGLKTDDAKSLSDHFRPSTFAELLSNRPRIALCVRNLDIHVIRDRCMDVNVICQLEKISTILPTLSGLRQIKLHHHPSHFDPGFVWGSQPESFRQAFLDCLRLPSMQDVSLVGIGNFPFTSFLNGECKNLKSLIVEGGVWKDGGPVQAITMKGHSYQGQSLPFESLCLRYQSPYFHQGFISWATTFALRLRSLEFVSGTYTSLPKLLTSCSNTLTSLCLAFIKDTTCYYYDFNNPPMIREPRENFPLTLSTLPRLENLTIHSKLQYHHSRNTREWGIYSPIPSITQFFDIKPPSESFKYLRLNFDCFIDNFQPAQLKFPPSLSVSDIICVPLIQLLSTITPFSESSSSSSPGIHVDLCLNGSPTDYVPVAYPPKAMPLLNLLSPLADCEELMRFVDLDVLTIIPIDSTDRAS